jgi:hypothetical protein
VSGIGKIFNPTLPKQPEIKKVDEQAAADQARIDEEDALRQRQGYESTILSGRAGNQNDVKTGDNSGRTGKAILGG